MSMNLIRLAIVTTSLVFSSCIEFERQEISYIHDDDKDELRLTLVYDGIFGSLKEGFESKKKDAKDLPHKDRLNRKQIKQVESVLEQNRAFFFTNWIFEYSPNTLPKMLQELFQRNPNGIFAKPEQDLIEALLKNVEVENIGFFKDEAGKLCGAQTMRISNLSKVIPLINTVIRRQMLAHLPELQQEVTKQTKGAYTQGTVDLITQKLKDEYSFLQIDGNRITFQMIMNLIDQGNFTKEGKRAEELPTGTRFANRDDHLLLEIGEKSAEFVTLEKKCFDGYVPNALNHVEQKHGVLMLAPNKVKNRLKMFLEGSR